MPIIGYYVNPVGSGAARTARHVGAPGLAIRMGTCVLKLGKYVGAQHDWRIRIDTCVVKIGNIRRAQCAVKLGRVRMGWVPKWG